MQTGKLAHMHARTCMGKTYTIQTDAQARMHTYPSFSIPPNFSFLHLLPSSLSAPFPLPSPSPSLHFTHLHKHTHPHIHIHAPYRVVEHTDIHTHSRARTALSAPLLHTLHKAYACAHKHARTRFPASPSPLTTSSLPPTPLLSLPLSLPAPLQAVRHRQGQGLYLMDATSGSPFPTCPPFVLSRRRARQDRHAAARSSTDLLRIVHKFPPAEQPLWCASSNEKRPRVSFSQQRLS